MGYEELWRVLDSLVTELRQKGEIIPHYIMKDLHSAKTMIKILRADPTHIENIPKVETYLESVEFHLVSMAQGKFGTKNVEQWMKKLEEARKEVNREEAVSRFVPGIPSGKHWVRVQATEETPQKEIEKLAEKSKLSHKVQDDGYVLVWGKSGRIKSFIGDLREAQMALKSSHLMHEK